MEASYHFGVMNELIASASEAEKTTVIEFAEMECRERLSGAYRMCSLVCRCHECVPRGVFVDRAMPGCLCALYVSSVWCLVFVVSDTIE